jgi:EAL domain-containing protein (putative c-di-GMP-specific phosphodiesterase class I)
MGLAKEAGRDSLRFFTAQMNVDVLARLDLEAALRQAVEHDEFILYYQPKMHLRSGRISGLEALLRWQRPGHGVVSPGDFIPVLEETGMIVDVGDWVILSVCEQMAAWSASSIGQVHVAVNIAARQFVEGDLDRVVVDALGMHGVAGEFLELELTESALMVNTERTIDRLMSLKRRGVQLSIDDFGTGYSSLAYLRRFPIDKLKIDIDLVRDITNDPDDAAIALTIINMAHSLQLIAIAEGVETAEQLDCLGRLGCDEIQGYYFSRPLPVPKVEQLLREDIRHMDRESSLALSANTGGDPGRARSISRGANMRRP